MGAVTDPMVSCGRGDTRFEVEGGGRQVGELAGDEVGDGDQVLDGAIAASLSLGRLNQQHEDDMRAAPPEMAGP